MLTIQVVKTGRHVARHFNVLNLIAAHRHFVRLEHQDVGTHEHGIHEQASRNVCIGVIACQVVFIHRRFVGVRSVEHALACDASQKPRELWNFWNVRLAIKHHALGVQTGCNPTGGNF